MSVKIIADVREHEQARVAVLEDGKLAEIFIEYCDDETPSRVRTGDIFKARVQTLVPAINAAFVKLSAKSHVNLKGSNNAFMYADEVKSPSQLKPGHEVIVQVVRNARKNKAPRVTANVSIPGRWLVLAPNDPSTGVSQRINDPSERKRLKDIAASLQAEIHPHGVIVRTAAEGVSEEFLRKDLDSLMDLWRNISDMAESSHEPCLLYRDLGTFGRVLRDDVAGKIDEIIIDDAGEFEAVKSFVERFYPERPNVTLYDGITPVFEFFGIEDEIRKAVERKVWLKSGAYLVIDQTEALTVIDVNTGRFTSEPDMKHTTLATNKEAAQEIARQLRLRAIGGIVVVDFVDMDSDKDKHELLQHFSQYLGHDRMKPKICSLTRLGLVELTRKRERPDLRSIITRPCPECGDDGFVERDENIAVSIKRFIRKITSSNGAEAFVILTDKNTADYVGKFIEAWQKEFGRKIIVIGTERFRRGKYRLEFQGNYSEAVKKSKQL